MTNETVDNRLTDFLREGKDWERKQTNVPGVFLLKLPAFRSTPACIEIEIDALGRGAGRESSSTVDNFVTNSDSGSEISYPINPIENSATESGSADTPESNGSSRTDNSTSQSNTYLASDPGGLVEEGLVSKKLFGYFKLQVEQ